MAGGDYITYRTLNIDRRDGGSEGGIDALVWRSIFLYDVLRFEVAGRRASRWAGVGWCLEREAFFRFLVCLLGSLGWVGFFGLGLGLSFKL